MYSVYSGMSWRDGSSLASRVTRPSHSGWSERKSSNACIPRTTFLDGSVRSTRSTTFSGRHALSASRSATTASLAASRSNSSGSTEIGRLTTRTVRPRKCTVAVSASTVASVNCDTDARKLPT